MKKINVRHPNMLFIFGSLLFMVSCKKDLQQFSQSPTVINSESVKVLKIRKFISIISEVPFDKVKFDPTSNEYVFGSDHFEQKMIEDLYDKSNMYHVEYEKSK